MKILGCVSTVPTELRELLKHEECNSITVSAVRITVLEVWASPMAFFKPGFCFVPAWSASALRLFFSVIFYLLQLLFLSPHNSLGKRGWNTTESEQCSFLPRKENVCSFCPSSCCEVFSEVFTATHPWTFIPVHSIIIYSPLKQQGLFMAPEKTIK